MSVKTLVEQEVLVAEPLLKEKRPPLYRVWILNDDFTPMDFVVQILMQFFQMSEEKASIVMWQVHTNGRGVCGVYTRDIAETRVALVNTCARSHQHPLLCVMEPES